MSETHDTTTHPAEQCGSVNSKCDKPSTPEGRRMTTRRAFLTTAGAAAVTVPLAGLPAVALPDPDAELLAAYAEFNAFDLGCTLRCAERYARGVSVPEAVLESENERFTPGTSCLPAHFARHAAGGPGKVK